MILKIIRKLENKNLCGLSNFISFTRWNETKEYEDSLYKDYKEII